MLNFQSDTQWHSATFEEKSARLKTLESQHKELEQQLHEKRQSLKLQLESLMAVYNEDALQQTNELINSLVKKQEELQALYSYQLINHQIRIQEEFEHIEIVKEYESRVKELRASLGQKETEITIETGDRTRETLPRRENIQAWSLANSQDEALLEAFKEYSKLWREVTDMESLVGEIRPSSLDQVVEGPTVKPAGSPTQRSSSLTSKDKKKDQMKRDPFKERYLNKVYALLQHEDQRESALRVEYEELKDQFDQLSKLHSQLAQEYKAVSVQTTGAKKNGTKPLRQ